MSSDAAAIRAAAIAAHGETWRLLETANRTLSEDAAMVAAARVSLANWLQVGTTMNEQRGVWLLARVHVAIGEERPAAEYAAGTLALTEAHRNELKDFDLAFADEIAARAFALAGNIGRAKDHFQSALKLGHAIRNEDDRRSFFDQFHAGPWFALSGFGDSRESS
jgi:hypothetical protein